MVILAVTTGLRRGELFALKWKDISFSTFMLDVQRSIYLGKIGNCKTEASRASQFLCVSVRPRIFGFGRKPANIGKKKTGYLQVPIQMGSTRSGQIPYYKKSSDRLPEKPESRKYLGGIHSAYVLHASYRQRGKQHLAEAIFPPECR